MRAAAFALVLSVGCGSSPQAAEPRTVTVASASPDAAASGAPARSGSPRAPTPRSRECAALVAVINRGVRALEAEPSGDPIADLRRMAGSLEGIASDTGKLSPTIPALRRLSAEYRQMVTTAATRAREMADAASAKDVAKMREAQAGLEAAVKREDPLVDEINKFCQES